MIHSINSPIAWLIVMGGPEAVGELRRRYGGDLYTDVKATLERPAPGRA